MLDKYIVFGPGGGIIVSGIVVGFNIDVIASVSFIPSGL